MSPRNRGLHIGATWQIQLIDLCGDGDLTVATIAVVAGYLTLVNGTGWDIVWSSNKNLLTESQLSLALIGERILC